MLSHRSAIAVPTGIGARPFRPSTSPSEHFHAEAPRLVSVRGYKAACLDRAAMMAYSPAASNRRKPLRLLSLLNRLAMAELDRG